MNGLLILMTLLLLADAALIARALQTGRWGIGEPVRERSAEPAEYWFGLFTFAFLLPFYIGAMFLSDRTGGDPPSAGFLLIPLLAFRLVRLLQTRKARIGLDDFGRADTPGVYWAVVAGWALTLAAALWLTLPWPTDRG